jgi:hypothetical protein
MDSSSSTTASGRVRRSGGGGGGGGDSSGGSSNDGGAGLLLVKLLGEGEQLLVVRGHGVEEAVPVEEVVANKQFVGLYFSAHWCAPPPPHNNLGTRVFVV